MQWQQESVRQRAFKYKQIGKLSIIFEGLLPKQYKYVFTNERYWLPEKPKPSNQSHIGGPKNIIL